MILKALIHYFQTFNLAVKSQCFYDFLLYDISLSGSCQHILLIPTPCDILAVYLGMHVLGIDKIELLIFEFQIYCEVFLQIFGT